MAEKLSSATGCGALRSTAAGDNTLFSYKEEQFSIAYDDPTKATIYTAFDKLILTQSLNAPSGTQFVSADIDWTIYADTVIIDGPLSFPGRTVIIYARVVGAQGDQPGINVDGTAPEAATPPTVPQGQAGAGTSGTLLPSRKNGGTGHAGAPGTACHQGATGAQGGQLTINAGSYLPGTVLALSAQGGAGQAGTNGQGGQPGGDGGAGADGVYTDPFDTVDPTNGGRGGAGGRGCDGGPGGTGGQGGFIQIGRIVPGEADLTVSANANGGQGGDGGSGGTGGHGGTGGDGGFMQIGHDGVCASGGGGGDGGNGGASGSGGAALFGIELAGVTAKNPTVDGGAPGEIVGAVGSGGGGGLPATGNCSDSSDAPSAVTGKHGDPGTLKGAQGQNGASRNINSGTAWGYELGALFSSAEQCLMILEKAKLLYMTADPTDNPSAYGQAATLLTWLQNVTQPFTMDGLPLGNFPAADVPKMQAIYLHASGLAFQLNQGRDIFGNLPSYVPQGSYNFYQGLLTIILQKSGTFTAIETSYKNYFEALSTQSATLGQLEDGSSQSHSQLNSAQATFNTMVASATALVTTIGDDETAVDNQYPVMTDAIESIEHKLAVLAGVKCTFDTLVSGLKTVATMPVDGDFEQASKIADQVSSDVGTGTSFVSGIGTKDLPSVNLVQKLDVLGDNFDQQALTEGYTENAGLITEADPDAAKLLAAQSDFDKVLEPYMSLAGTVNAEDQVQQYVTLVQQRNTDVLTYNSYIGQLATLQGQINQLNTQISQVQAAIGENSNPELAPLVAFMARLYHEARSQVIFQIDMAGRSLRYWSLNPGYSAFTSFIGLTDPTGINSKSLTAALQTVLTDFSKAIEKFGTGAQTFPSPTTSHRPQGIAFVLTKSESPGLFQTLMKTNQLSFTIPLVMKSTTESQCVFFDKANVRLAKVRPWVQGAVTDSGVLTVDITHTGAETIVDPTNNPIAFTHAPITKTFKFNTASSTMFEESAIVQDSNFDTPGQESLYAQPGPFTIWRLSINQDYNTGLDLTNVDKITVEFQGNSFAFVV